MTAPTQDLPSWLTCLTTVATNDQGIPTATFTTIVNLPLTYYGPPIPLGPDSVWVYGGLSSPPPSSFSPTNAPESQSSITSFTLATPTSVSAIPPTTFPSPSSATISTLPSTSSSAPLTSSSTPSSLAPSSASSPVSPSSTSSRPTGGTPSSGSNHAGIIAGAVLGSVFGSLVLLFALILCLRRRQRGQQRYYRPPEPPTGQVMWQWHDLHASEDDQDADLGAQLGSPDDASPQTSGDERDTFLRRSRATSNSARPTSSVRGTQTSRDSSGPIGVAYAESSKPNIPPGQRHIISPEQLAEVSSDIPPSSDVPKPQEEVDLGPDAPLLPPRTLNLDITPGSRKSFLASERSMTPGNDPESAQLYTAQRVQVGQSTPSSPGSTWAEGIGIPNILRRSWLNPKPRSTTPTTSTPSFVTRQLTDTEVEAGRSLNAQLRSEMGYRGGTRPISGVSAMSTGSGNTIFYDAQSREDLSSSPPIPQGTSSTGRSGPLGPSPLSAEPLRASDEIEEPPTYHPRVPGALEPDDAVDYLDVPIPRPASPFASASSAKRLSTPPGLGTLGSFPMTASSSDAGTTINVNVELLEEAPPAAGESWRQIAQGLPSLQERRTTFGLMPSSIVYPRDQTVSEHGSLHSMHSHVSPHSARSISGSAPASNSNSQHSRGFTPNSLRSLAHSSSVSSTDRRLVRRSPGEVSPPLSATGHGRSSFSLTPRGLAEPTLLPPAAAPPLVQSATMTSTTTRSSVTTHTSMTDPVTGEVVRISHPSWTGGRDVPPVESELRPPPSSWGGSWTSPGHLRILQNRVAGRENARHA